MRTLIGRGRHQDGLYLLEPSQEGKVAMKVDKSNDMTLWHSRLGHASESKMSHVGLNVDIVRNQIKMPCDSCIRAKQTKLPFPLSSIKTTYCDLIHCDIWGRYTAASNTGAHYFLSIVDDFSRGVWVYLMRHKTEVERYLPMFICMIETQFGKTIKHVRSDNGNTVLYPLPIHHSFLI